MSEAALRFSRGALLAGRAAANPEGLYDRMARTRVTVSVEYGLPGAELTARAIVSTLRRLPCELALVVDRGTSAFAASLQADAYAVDPDAGLELVAMPKSGIHIHVGTNINRAAIRVVPDNHGMRLATNPRAVLRQFHSPSALGCITAGTFAVAEAFKSLADVKESRFTRPGSIAFCPVAISRDLTIARPLEGPLTLNAALVGLGAIGSAHTVILSHLDAEGFLILCDPEAFDVPNVGTYSYGTLAQAIAKVQKVDIARALLTDFTTHPVYGTSKDLIEKINAGSISAPPTVLAGLDSVEARYQTQRLYPEHLIDGATGDTTVSLHHSRHGCACIQCLVPQITSTRTAAETQADVMGIPVWMLNDGDTEFTVEHLAAARPEVREQLKAFVGKPVCSIPSASQLSNTEPAGYNPAAPFIAQLAACLDVGRLIAIETGTPIQDNFVQMDPLLGPQFIDAQDRAQRRDCVCVKRARVIKAVRSGWRDAS